MLPWRGDAQERDKTQSEQIDKLIELERLRIARDSLPPVVTPGIGQPPLEAEAKPETSPLIAGLCALGAVALGFVIYFNAGKD